MLVSRVFEGTNELVLRRGKGVGGTNQLLTSTPFTYARCGVNPESERRVMSPRREARGSRSPGLEKRVSSFADQLSSRQR